MKSKYKFLCIVVCTFNIITCTIFSINLQKVQAYTGVSAISEKTLYNETNT